MSVRFHIIALVVLSGLIAHGEGSSTSPGTTVGRRGTVEFSWSGEPLRTVDQHVESAFHCEIVSLTETDDGAVYKMAYTLLEPGTYNLNTVLLNLYGQPVEGLPDVIVSTETLLPADHKGALLDQSLRPVKEMDGFSARMILLSVLWIIAGGVGLRVLWPRKEVVVERESSRGPTVAEALEPYLKKAADGSLTTDEKVTLNLILFNFWRAKLDLKDVHPTECMARLRDHDQAGALVKRLDEWFFSPKPVEGDGLQDVLKPYTGTLAADLHMEDLA